MFFIRRVLISKGVGEGFVQRFFCFFVYFSIFWFLMASFGGLSVYLLLPNSKLWLVGRFLLLPSRGRLLRVQIFLRCLFHPISTAWSVSTRAYVLRVHIVIGWRRHGQLLSGVHRGFKGVVVVPQVCGVGSKCSNQHGRHFCFFFHVSTTVRATTSSHATIVPLRSQFFSL